jgi:hypothetical protein
MKAIGIMFVLVLMATFAQAAKPSFNEEFVGTWNGSAPTRTLCSGGKGNINLRVLKPKLEPGENYKVMLVADWGCFSEMKIPGFIFNDEFWGTSEDRMTFVKLKLNKPHNLSGEFRVAPTFPCPTAIV